MATTHEDEVAYRACKIWAREGGKKWWRNFPGPARQAELMSRAKAELKSEGLI
jgi:hypothetical protein